MRLRLVVKRHDLPDAAVVWPVDDSARVIVSQLLEQVNETIPLESEGEWGLEDYAVEIRGKEANYECLHFQDVKSILHEDDEVIIRPLLSDDIKQRRASGRYQITSDGIHLFDGAVFGRPRRRMIESRPAVTINPRKRRRVTYTETVDNDLEDEDSEESLLRIEGPGQEIDDAGNQQLVIRADFDNDDEDESEDDGNFESADEDMDEDLSVDEGELEGELEALNAESEDDGASDKENNHGSKRDGAQTGDKLDPKTHNIIQLQEAFPDAPPAICQQVLQNCDMDVGAAYDTLSKGFKPGRSKTAVRSRMRSPSETTKASRSSRGRSRSAEVVEQETDFVAEDQDQADEANDEEDEEDEEEGSDEDDGGMAGYYDSHGLPPGSINIGKGLSDTAKINLAQATNIPLPPSRHSVLRRSDSPSSSKSVRFVEDTVLVHDPDAIPLDDDSDDEDDEDFDVAGESESDSGSSSDSRSDSSDSDSDAEMEDSAVPTVPTTEVAEDLTSSSGSDDSSSSDSESESSSDSDSDSDSDSSDSDSEPEEASSKAPVEPKAPTASKLAANSKKDTTKTVPPGEGRNSTKARNQRRRSGNILQRFKEKGILPAGVTLVEFGKLDIDSNTSPEAAAEALAVARAQIEEEEAMGLRAKTSKGKTSKKANKDAEFEARRQELLASLSLGGVDVGATLSNGLAAAKTPNGTGPSHLDDQSSAVPASTDKDLTSSASAKKKSKVDIDAGRRLLFGALGIKNPKTKADEDNIRDKLMKDVRKVKEPEPEVPETAADDEDMDSWKEKITLRAVECCQEGIELSEPPFPFVQRWDPQQQYVHRKGKRGGKGKKNQRNQPEYYEEEQASAKKQKRNHDSNGSNGYDDYTEYSEEGQNSGDVDQYDIEDDQTYDQVMEDSQGVDGEPTDENDLPSLPADTSSLADIDPKDMKPGMVVAFKQLIMSEATSWQPVISEYRTAVVNIVSDKNEVELTLAIRDREYPERYYNQETGERIYGKFDMPVEDEEEDEDLDDGFRALGFPELMEPKLLQAEPENLTIDGLPEPESDKVITSTDESTTLAHEQHDAPKESIETPQVADEDRISVQDLQTEGNSPPRLPSEQLPSIQHSTQVDDEMVDVSITEESREDISILMREAGFRSDIPSSVLKNRPQLPDTPGDNDELKRLAQSMNVSLNEATTPGESSQLSHVEDEDNSTPTQSNFYPKLSIPSPLASQTSDQGQRQPDFPTPGESTLDRFGDSNSFPLSQDGFSLGSVHAGTPADEPRLPSLQPNHAGAALQGPPSPSERESSLVDFPSPSDMFSTARSSFAAKQDDSQPVIAPTSTSIEANKSYEDAMAKLDAELDARSDPDQNSGGMTPRGRSADRFISQLVESVDRQESEANGRTSARNPRRSPELPSQKLPTNSSPFVVPTGSQQVDLTLSSDNEFGANAQKGVDDDDSEYDPDMPRGPGWVRKRKLRRQTAGSASNSQASGSQSRTRSQRRRRVTMGV
ncbi:hypothetical protein VE03_05802 [Pseudogymnoascus sp. 23342-1-I1]|nr:hypothetical protein VE03_05802 [Pseudogymnoascus sp. 23342-1-I1]